METQRSIWDAFQGLRLGSDREPWDVHQDAQRQFEKEHQLCLVVQGLNLVHQNPAGIKKTLQAAWAAKGCVDAKINDDGTVNFYFSKEYQLMSILENAPYEYRGWMVAIDAWKNSKSPMFLQQIPFWIHIDKLPEEFRRRAVVESIGSMMGHVDEVRIIEPVLHLKKPAEVWIRVTMSVDSEISLVRRVKILNSRAPVELEFKFKKLQKFCTTCGSMRHGYDICPKASTLTGALMEISHTHFLTATERLAAIEGLNTGQDLGAPSDSPLDLPSMLVPISDYLAELVSSASMYNTDVYINDGDKKFCLSYVYGNPVAYYRNQQWKDMILQVERGDYLNIPRLVLGDFNDIKFPYEKEGGATRSEGSFLSFRNMLSLSGLHNVKTFGGLFTWVGKRYSHTVRTKIDRAVATGDWFDLYPTAFVQVLPWTCSDHRALILHTHADSWKRKKLFRYDRRCRFESEVQDIIQNLWRERCKDIPSIQFSRALELSRKVLSGWKSQHITNTQRRIKDLKKSLQEAYEHNTIDFELIGELKSNLAHAYKLEEEFWRAKSRVLWLQAGDKNTKFFHAKTRRRRAFNRIISLTTHTGRFVFKQEEINQLVVEYFQGIFSTTRNSLNAKFLNNFSQE